MLCMAKYLEFTGYGLTTAKQVHINRIIKEYDPHLSLRRVPQNDPAYKPGEAEFGIFEEGVHASQRPWAFLVGEQSVDERLLARVMEADMTRQGVPARMAKFMAIQKAAEQAKLDADRERIEERTEEMVGVAKMGDRTGDFTHTINGRKYRIGDMLRPVPAPTVLDLGATRRRSR